MYPKPLGGMLTKANPERESVYNLAKDSLTKELCRLDEALNDLRAKAAPFLRHTFSNPHEEKHPIPKPEEPLKSANIDFLEITKARVSESLMIVQDILERLES